MRSLLSTELMEEIDGRLTVTDVDPSGNRFVKFWIDDFPSSPAGEATAPLGGEPVLTRGSQRSIVPPFPLLGGEGGVERGPSTPERREGLTPGYIGATRGIGLGALVLAQALPGTTMMKEMQRAHP